MTSHLESTREHSAERIRQLKTVLGKMQEAPDSTTVIFAGDTNLRDQEVSNRIDSMFVGRVLLWKLILIHFIQSLMDLKYKLENTVVAFV
jgi:hypothetical protein